MRRVGWLLVVVVGTLWAASPPTPPADSRPPLPPLGAPPTQLFRSLLSTNSAGREALLRLRSSEQRNLLEQKLAEY